ESGLLFCGETGGLGGQIIRSQIDGVEAKDPRVIGRGFARYIGADLSDSDGRIGDNSALAVSDGSGQGAATGLGDRQGRDQQQYQSARQRKPGKGIVLHTSLRGKLKRLLAV